MRELKTLSQFTEAFQKLGDADSEKREAQFRWLDDYFGRGHCPPVMHRDLLQILTSQRFLFWNIDDVSTSAAVKRSFSSLAIASLLYANIKSNSDQLTNDELTELAKKLVRYWSEEKNFEGRNDSFGWVHCHAHVSDAIKTLAYHPKLTSAEAENMLGTLLELVAVRKEVFEFGEETRLAMALCPLIYQAGPAQAIRHFERYQIGELSQKRFPQNLRLVFLALHMLLDRTQFPDLSKLLISFVTYF